MMEERINGAASSSEYESRRQLRRRSIDFPLEAERGEGLHVFGSVSRSLVSSVLHKHHIDDQCGLAGTGLQVLQLSDDVGVGWAQWEDTC